MDVMDENGNEKVMASDEYSINYQEVIIQKDELDLPN